MTLSIFGLLAGIGGIFGSLGGLGITSLSAFLIGNGGSFIDFFKGQQEQLGIDQDPLQGASLVAVSGLPSIPSYNIKLTHISNYIKNMKGVFEVSYTQKQDPSETIIEQVIRNMDTERLTGVQYGNSDLMSLILNPRIFLDEKNPPAPEYKNIPSYLKTELFQSILGEINKYLEREKDIITKEIEELTEQEALSHVNKLVMNYLNTEKSNLMNKLIQKDKKQSNKVAPKVPSYISAIHLLKFLPDSVTIKAMVRKVSNVKQNYFYYVRDLLRLTKKHERVVYNMKIIKGLVEKINLKISRENNRDVKLKVVSPKTQAEFSNMEGDNAYKQIILEDEAGNQYQTTGTSLKQGRVPQKLSGKVKYTFPVLEEEVNRRGDELIFPKTKEEWDTIGGTPADRNIIIKCGDCDQERPLMVKTYFEYERCPTCFHIETRKWTYKNIEKYLKDRGYRFHKFSEKDFDAQTGVSPVRRKIRIQCIDCLKVMTPVFHDLRQSRVCQGCLSKQVGRTKKGAFPINPIYKSIISDQEQGLLNFLEYLVDHGGKTPIFGYDHSCSQTNNAFTNLDAQARKDLIVKFTNLPTTTIVYPKGVMPKNAPGFIRDIVAMANPKNGYTKDDLYHSHGEPPHEVLLPRILNKLKDYAIVIETPVSYLSKDNNRLAGHIDLMLYDPVTETLYICDYKPNEDPRPSGLIGKSFINDLPQIGLYGKIVKEKFRIKNIKCVTFNYKGAWIYDPDIALDTIIKFYQEQKLDLDLAWLLYFKGENHDPYIFNNKPADLGLLDK